MPGTNSSAGLTDRATQQRSVDVLRETIGVEVADLLRPLLLIAAALTLFHGVAAVVSGTLSVWLVIEVLDMCAWAAVVWLSRAPRARALAMGWGSNLLACMALLHFGPFAGAGVFFACAIVLTSFYFGRVGGLVSLAAMALAFSLAVVGESQGWLHATTALPVVLWVRIGVSSGLALFATSRVFDLIQRASGAAIERERLALATLDATHHEREQWIEQTMRGQRLESLGRLAGGVAHDFNNALTVIHQGVELLETCDEDRQELLTEIRCSVEGAAATAKQLLAFARSQPVDVGTCQPQALLVRLSTSLSKLLPETIELVVDAIEVGPVPIPTPSLEQVLLNLIMNARDAMPKGGTVRLACRHEGDRVLVEVADDGVGMTSDVAARVFEPFFTTKDHEGGSGLGLAMVWGIVTRYGGTVALDSAPGAGTRISLSLPLVVEQQEEPSPSKRKRPSSNAPLAVLVLEDQPEVRRMLSRILRREGYAVTAVEDAAAARRELDVAHFAALVTDGIVPGGGVPAVIEAFRRLRPAAPVVVCSGHLEEELMLAGIEARDYRFLRKPFSADDLLSAIQQETPVTG